MHAIVPPTHNHHLFMLDQAGMMTDTGGGRVGGHPGNVTLLVWGKLLPKSSIHLGALRDVIVR